MALRVAAVGDHIVHIEQEQPEAPPRELQSSTPWRVFGVGIPVLIALVQLHFYDSSPFDTRPLNMWTAVFAVFILCIAYGKDTIESSRSFQNIRVQVGYVSGLLASAALISVLVPPSLGPFVLVAWMIASIMFVNVTRNWILQVVKTLLHLTKNAVSYVHNTWKGIIGNNNNVGATTSPA